MRGVGWGDNICIVVQISKSKKKGVSLAVSPREAVGCAGPLDELLDAEFFKGLADPTRLLLLGCLAKCGRACSVSELAECCVVDFSVVSRHLKALERAGIVEAGKSGRTVYYTVRYDDVAGKFESVAEALRGYGA